MGPAAALVEGSKVRPAALQMAFADETESAKAGFLDQCREQIADGCCELSFRFAGNRRNFGGMDVMMAPLCECSDVSHKNLSPSPKVMPAAVQAYQAARIRNSVALATGTTWRDARRSSTSP